MTICRYCPTEITGRRTVQCGSDDCTKAYNRARTHARELAYKAQHGHWYSSRYVTPKAFQTKCSGCARPLRYSRTPEPLCRSCYNEPRKPETRRVLAERKLERAMLGTSGTAVMSAGPCNWCGTLFAHTRVARWCSESCKRKAIKNRRLTNEAGGTHWRWSDFMRMARRFSYCCAYCGIKPDRLDPDHVLAVSRGGANSLSNLLPACLACNSDKRNLLLSEWNADRARRGLDPRITDWQATDPRYWHLSYSIAA